MKKNYHTIFIHDLLIMFFNGEVCFEHSTIIPAAVVQTQNVQGLIEFWICKSCYIAYIYASKMHAKKCSPLKYL